MLGVADESVYDEFCSIPWAIFFFICFNNTVRNLSLDGQDYSFSLIIKPALVEEAYSNIEIRCMFSCDLYRQTGSFIWEIRYFLIKNIFSFYCYKAFNLEGRYYHEICSISCFIEIFIRYYLYMLNRTSYSRFRE